MKLAMHIVGLRTKCFMYLKIKHKTTSIMSLSNYNKIKTAAALKNLYKWLLQCYWLQSARH